MQLHEIKVQIKYCSVMMIHNKTSKDVLENAFHLCTYVQYVTIQLHLYCNSQAHAVLVNAGCS